MKLKKLKAVYNGEDTVILSAKKCLALQVTRFVSCSHYEALAKTVNNAKTCRDWQLLSRLTEVEITILPVEAEYSTDSLS